MREGGVARIVVVRSEASAVLPSALHVKVGAVSVSRREGALLCSGGS